MKNDPELLTIADLRFGIVDARADLRFLEESLGVLRRSIEREALAALSNDSTGAAKPTEQDKKRAIDWALDDSTRYRKGLRQVRDQQRVLDRLEAQLSNALAGPRKEEWLTRQRLADALAEYAARPCMGVQEHALIDTAIDSTGDDGPYVGDSRFADEASRKVA